MADIKHQKEVDERKQDKGGYDHVFGYSLLPLKKKQVNNRINFYLGY